MAEKPRQPDETRLIEDLARGTSNTEAARRSGLSVRTVHRRRSHSSAIALRMGSAVSTSSSETDGRGSGLTGGVRRGKPAGGRERIRAAGGWIAGRGGRAENVGSAVRTPGSVLPESRACPQVPAAVADDPIG